MTKIAFSGLTEAQAAKLLLGFRAAAESNYRHMQLRGAWVGRRLVLVDGYPSKSPVPDQPSNLLALTLSLSIDIDAEALTKRCRSFGATVERFWRDNDLGRFDRVVSLDDGDRHTVHAYHHVALCGHKADRWLLDCEVPSGAEVNPCTKCAAVAATRPHHRARYHPLSGDKALR